MKKFVLTIGLLAAPMLALPGLALAQNQTAITGSDTPHDPSVAGTPHAAPPKPDQAAVTPRVAKPKRARSTRQSLQTRDPFVPSADQSPQQKALPTRVP